MKKPEIIIVGADKGGVGKTTITRVLSDYLKLKNVPCRYYDTEWPAGDLKRFITDAEVVDITKVASQMKIFDVLDPTTVTIIDLRSGLLSPILVELDDARLLDEVHAGRMNLVLLHILGSTITSLQEIITTANKIGGGAKHYLVKNYINDSTFFEWDHDQDNSPLRRMTDSTITIPQLTELAAEQIQKQACSFASFAEDKNQSRILRGKVHHWVEAIWKEFDRVNLAVLEDARVDILEYEVVNVAGILKFLKAKN